MDLNQLALTLFNNLNALTGNLGYTIIIIAIASRLIIFPFTLSTLRYAKKMQAIKPRLDELKTKHKDDRKKQMEEQARIMKEENVNPLSGCLPILVQFGLLIFLYHVLTQLINAGHNTQFLWFDLSKADVLPVAGLPFGWQLPGLLVVLTAITTFINAKMSMPAGPLAKPADPSDFGSAMQTQSLYIFPLLTLFIGTLWPSGLALYWTVGTVVDIVQRYYAVGLGGLADWVKIGKS